MERIINGMRFTGERVPNAWDLSIFEVNGHRELSARQVVEWTESIIPDGWVQELDEPDPVLDADWIAEQKEKSLKKAAQRAQTNCRRLIKASNFREMLTITYRENQQDRDVCKHDFELWVKRMRRAFPKFQYCAAFERQERGSMHVHCATNKLPKHVHHRGVKIEAWRLPTILWREIVGADNGLVFVGGKPRWGGGRRRNLSLAKMASYVSKYIMKDYADCPEGSNRYSRSNSIDLPKPTHIRLTDCSLDDLIRVAFEVPAGSVVVSHRIGDWQDSYWLCTEPGSVRSQGVVAATLHVTN